MIKFKFQRSFRVGKFQFRRQNPWNYSDFGGDSDFFTLDPNLATALKNTTAGGITSAEA